MTRLSSQQQADSALIVEVLAAAGEQPLNQVGMEFVGVMKETLGQMRQALFAEVCCLFSNLPRVHFGRDSFVDFIHSGTFIV